MRTSLPTPSSQAAGTSNTPTASGRRRENSIVNRAWPARGCDRDSSQRPSPSGRGRDPAAGGSGSRSGSARTTTLRTISRSRPTSNVAVRRLRPASQSMSLKLTAERTSEARRSRASAGRTIRTRSAPDTSKPAAEPAAGSQPPPLARSHCQALARSGSPARPISSVTRAAGGRPISATSRSPWRMVTGRQRSQTRCRPGAVAKSRTSEASEVGRIETPGGTGSEPSSQAATPGGWRSRSVPP